MNRLVAACAAGMLAAMVAGSASAQASFPTRAVRFIIPFPGGGINDILARIIGEKLQAKWGRPIVIENKTGAGGNIGAELAYQSEPDGYTLLLAPPGPLAINQTLYKQLSYKPQDFVPLTAEVIGRPPSEFNQQVTIAAGSGSGVRVDQAVVTADGLVGKVSKVAGHQAQVMLLTDPSMKVAALDLDAQAAGLVGHGQGPGTLTLDRVKKSSVVNPGDSIVTQGFKLGPLSSIYPANIPIGYVTGASLSEVDLFWQVQISPSVHFDSLRSVIVLVPKSRLR